MKEQQNQSEEQAIREKKLPTTENQPSVLSVDTDPLKWLTFRRSLKANQERTKELIRDMPPLPF